MAQYQFATEMDGDKFTVEGETLQSAFESIEFRAVDYASAADEAEELRGKPIRVWAWDTDGARHDWLAHFE